MGPFSRGGKCSGGIRICHMIPDLFSCHGFPPPHAADNNCVLFSHTRQKTFHPMKIFNHNSSYPLPFPSPCLKKEIKFDILIRLSPPFYLTIFEEKVRIDDPKFRNVSFLSYSPLPNALKWLFFLLLDIEEKMLKDF